MILAAANRPRTGFAIFAHIDSPSLATRDYSDAPPVLDNRIIFK